MERPCAWPTLYLEINGNDDDMNNVKHRLTHVSTISISKYKSDAIT